MLTVFELMSAYNISFEEAQILQFKIIIVMILISIGVITVLLLLKIFCPKIYKKLKKLNII